MIASDGGRGSRDGGGSCADRLVPRRTCSDGYGQIKHVWGEQHRSGLLGHRAQHGVQAIRRKVLKLVRHVLIPICRDRVVAVAHHFHDNTISNPSREQQAREVVAQAMEPMRVEPARERTLPK